MKKLISTSLGVFALLLLVIVGCRRNNSDTETMTTATQTSTDNSQAENTYDDAGAQVDDAAMRSAYLDPQSTLTPSTSCPTVTINHPDTTTWPKVVTIDFGTTNCTGSAGNARRGQIIATFSGPYRATGTVITITFNNYYVNDNHVEGIKTVTNAGLNSLGQMYWTVNVANAKITRTDGTFVTWNSTRTRTWVAGQATIGNITDDAYQITGSATGSNENGNSFKATITSPLYLAWGCRWIEAGTIQITPTGKATRTIDYGTASNCDNQATVTINGTVYTITLRN